MKIVIGNKMKTIEPNQPIRIAFLGCGFATRLHSKTLSGFGSDIHRYYASRSAEKALNYNQKYKGKGFFDSYETAIASTDIDVVLVATPPVSHLDLALQALRAGKHVIVEKPPFFKSSDFDTVQAAGEKAERRVFIAENYFYKPSLVKLRELLKSGIIGDILFVHLNALKLQKTGNWRDNPELSGGGALFEGGIHWVNFMANLGLSVESVSGFHPRAKSVIEKSVLAVFQYREGAVGTLLYSWEVPTVFKGLRISRIFGREGSITFESNGIFIFARGKKKKLVFPGFSDIAGYKGMFRDFINALRTGQEAQFTLQLAKQDLTLIEEINKSK